MIIKTKLLKSGAVLFFFFAAGSNLYSQSVYTLDIKKDIFISALSVGAVTASYLAPGSRSDIGVLNFNDVNLLDRGLMFPENNTLHSIRDITRNIIPVLPIITPLSLWGLGGWKFDKDSFNTWLTYGIMYTQALALTFGTVEIIKKTVDRYRPRSYFISSADSFSNDCFPSDTTAISFLASTFLSVTFTGEFPDVLWKIPVIAGSYTLAASIGVLSVISGMHFLTDVLAAAAIGSFYGLMIPLLHKKPDTDKRISFHFTGNGGYLLLNI